MLVCVVFFFLHRTCGFSSINIRCLLRAVMKPWSATRASWRSERKREKSASRWTEETGAVMCGVFMMDNKTGFLFLRMFFTARVYAKLLHNDSYGRISIMQFFNYVMRKGERLHTVTSTAVREHWSVHTNHLPSLLLPVPFCGQCGFTRRGLAWVCTTWRGRGFSVSPWVSSHVYSVTRLH